LVCPSPACPPQAMLTDVIERINASCVPSAIASGISPISQFRSISRSPRFIAKSAPSTPSTLPALSAALSPFSNQPVQIESHRAAEAAPDYGNPRKPHWRSPDIPRWFAPPQKGYWESHLLELEPPQPLRLLKSFLPWPVPES